MRSESTGSSWRVGCLAAGWLAVVVGPAAAEVPIELPAFGEVIDVQVVNLEVVVSRRGEPVTGLDADDFQLLVDGEETPIEFFTEVAEGRAGAAPATAGTRPARVPGRAVGTRILVFVDDDFAIPSSRNRVLRELSRQVGLLGDGDSMAIVAYDGHRLDPLSGWTRSLSQLRGVLAEAQERRAYGLLRRSEQRRAYGRYGPRPPTGQSFSGTGFYGLGRNLAGSLEPEQLRYDDVYGRVSRVVRAAASALRGFAAAPGDRPPGRQVMLLLAGGWPTYPRWGAGAPEGMESDRQLFAPLIETANRLGYTLYPVDLQAGQGGAITAEYGTRAADRARAAGDLERERLAEDALYHLAEETGGSALLGGARLTALERVIDDTRSYYWLGFTPSWQADDSRHDVEVLAPGARVRTRRSFSDLSREAEVSMWLESAHLFDAPLPGAVDLAVRLGPPGDGGLGKVVVPLTLEVPLRHVTVVPREGGYESRLELRVVATDADGARADLPVVEVLIDGDGAPEPGAAATWETSLKLRRKPHRLLISLYDPARGQVLARRVDFEP